MNKDNILNISGDSNSIVYFNDNKNFIIDNSPVKFAIVGATSYNREVIIRSSNAGLDLIGSPLINKKNKINIFDSALLFNSFISKELSYNIIKTKNKHLFKYESRETEHWFIWQGYATKEEIKEIEDEFEKRIYDIKKGSKNSYGSLEWNLAPVITMCHNATNNRINSLKRLKFLLIGSSFIYISIIVYLTIMKII
ncbi:MAG: hypothetical protein HRT40_09165 [Campylobacteraceae bacterium]|nr:hypothetical protein [Campylobacteraceae bacterium]